MSQNFPFIGQKYIKVNKSFPSVFKNHKNGPSTEKWADTK